MLAWLYLVIASVLEVCWIYSLKYLSVADIRAIPWARAGAQPALLAPLLPLVGYIVFGVTNVVIFSFAIKHIPAATAFAAWTAMALIGSKLVDTFYFKEPFVPTQLLYMALIVIGIIGLNRSTI